VQRRPDNAARCGCIAALLGVAMPAAGVELVLTPVLDATLIQDDPSYANGAGPSVFIGAIASGGARRALLKFNVETIPPTAQITSVRLRFVINRAAVGSGGADPVALHRVTASWGEGTSSTTGGGGTQASPQDATWTHRFFGNPAAGQPGTLWTAAGGDFVAASSAAMTVGGLGAYQFTSTAQLVADVDAWRVNPANNHGWMLIGPELRDQTARRLHSRESSDVASQPQLLISYVEADSTADTPLPLWMWPMLGAGLLWQMRRRAA
jgi:MYXO-CTERM domain-containing protein